MKKIIKFDDKFFKELSDLCKIQGCSIDDYITSAIITKYEFDEQVKFSQMHLKDKKEDSDYGKALMTGEKIFINSVMEHIEDNYKFGSCGNWLMNKDAYFYDAGLSLRRNYGEKLEFKQFEI